MKSTIEQKFVTRLNMVTRCMNDRFSDLTGGDQMVSWGEGRVASWREPQANGGDLYPVNLPPGLIQSGPETTSFSGSNMLGRCKSRVLLSGRSNLTDPSILVSVHSLRSN